jgi:hypothetical protein
MITTVRVRLEHPSAVHFPALFWIARTAVSDTNTALSKATAMPSAFSDSEVCDRVRSQSNGADQHGTKQVIGSNAEINEAKLRFLLDRQLRNFEIKKARI